MVEFTEANLHWLEHEIDRKLPTFSVETADARTVKIPSGFSIVSEGYLGPPLSKAPNIAELSNLKSELSELYSQSLANWAKQLKPGTKICLAVPCWQVKNHFETLPLIDQIGEIGYNLVRFKHADSRKLIYARPDQIVGRQLLVLEKK